MFFTWPGHQAGILVFLIVIFIIALSNLVRPNRLKNYRQLASFPPVDVLIPARNEEHNIGKCLLSVLAQDYPNFSVYVLDDGSNDRTAEIVRSLTAQNPKLNLLSGEPLPHGWMGKHWACQQLVSVSQGELILFLDADTSLGPGSLQNAVAAVEAAQADLLSALPRQEVETWGEKMLVPFFMWALVLLLPLRLAFRLRWPAAAFTVGQFMLFKRKAYLSVGGHAAVRQTVTDDYALGKRIVSAGYRWRLVDGSDSVTTRMYRNGREAWNGFCRNLFPAFGYNIPVAIFIWLWLAVAFVEPLLLLLLFAFDLAPQGASWQLAVASVLVSLAAISWANYTLRFPSYLSFLYPLIVLSNVAAGCCSLVKSLRGQTVWKGRTLNPSETNPPTK